MDVTVDQVFEDAMKLPAEQRVDLLERLMEAMDGEEPQAEGIDWDKEIERRLDRLDSGESATYDRETARRMILEQREK